MPPKENIVDTGFDQKKKFGFQDFVMGHYKKSEVLLSSFFTFHFLTGKKRWI
jgi:hypothetical protein